MKNIPTVRTVIDGQRKDDGIFFFSEVAIFSNHTLQII